MKQPTAYIFVERTFLDASSEARPPLSFNIWFLFLLKKAKLKVNEKCEIVKQQFGTDELARRLAHGDMKVIVKQFGKYVHCQKMYPDADGLDSQGRRSPLYVFVVFGSAPVWTGCSRPMFDEFIDRCMTLARGILRSGVYENLRVEVPVGICR